jgi:hypothetical protein
MARLFLPSEDRKATCLHRHFRLNLEVLLDLVLQIRNKPGDFSRKLLES